MALVIADRIKETTATTGTGALALAGAVANFRAFSAVCSVNDTCYYTIEDAANGAWEVGLGTYSAANTLIRTKVLASSSGNGAVNLAAGTKQVWLDLAAAQLSAEGIGGGTKWSLDDAYPGNFLLTPSRRAVISLYTGTSLWATMRSDQSRASGKWYAELKIHQIAGLYSPLFGLAKSAAPLNNYCGSDANGWGIIMNGDRFMGGGSSPGSSYTAGDVVGIAVDFNGGAAGGRIDFYKNNAANGSFTGLTLNAPLFLATSNATSGSKATLCTNVSQCAYAPPSGYVYWDQ